MLRMIIAVLLLALVAGPIPRIEASGRATARESESRTEKIKAGIAKLGVGPDARVQIKLKNKTRLTGYVSEVADEFFVVTDAAGQTTTVAYPDVTQVQGNNLTTRTKVIIAASIAVGVIIVLYLVRGAFCDGC